MPAPGWPVSKPAEDNAAPRPQAMPALAPPPREDGVLAPLATVAARQDLAALAQRLDGLRAWLADDLRDLEAALQLPDNVAVPTPQGGNSKVGRAAHHLLQLPGKRIRPLCVILAARMGGRAMDAAVRDAATACELVHAATLLHDDVVDDSHERRGAPAARTLYGNAASILAGDHLLVHALRLVDRAGQRASQHASQPANEGAGELNLSRSLLDVLTRMVQAEAVQLERRGRFVPSRTAYLEVIRGKTAALFAWGLTAGGALGGADAATQRTLWQVGTHLGMAFQLVDDVLDMEGDPALTGKDSLQDVREGKLTWPLILAAEAEPALAQQLAAIAAEPRRNGPLAKRPAARLRQVRRRVVATGALAATRAFALQEAAAACACLAQLPAGRAREALQLVVQSAVHRLH